MIDREYYAAHARDSEPETLCEAIASAVLFVALIVLMFVCMSMVLNSRPAGPQAVAYNNAGPVCPDYGTGYHSCLGDQR